MNKNIIVVFLFLTVIADMLTCLAANEGLAFTNFSLLIKSPIELFFIYKCLANRSTQKYFYLIATFLIIWSIAIITTFLMTNGHVNFNSSAYFIDTADNNKPFMTSFVVFNRYLLFFCLFPVLLIYRHDNAFINKCKLVFELFFYVNSCFILLGVAFKLNVFASYYFEQFALQGADSRFGYKGLLTGINEVTGVYFLGLTYAYREVFVYGNKSKWILLILIIVASLLTGAKGCMLSFLLLTVYYLIKYRPKFFLMTILPLLAIGIYYLLHIDIIDVYTKIFTINFSKDGAGTDTPLELALTFLTSNRNLYVVNNWHYADQAWSVFNYIFGDGILYCETDLIDLYYMFGIGAILYLYFYRKLVLTERSGDIKYIFVFICLLAFTGGHFIRSAVVPVFLSLYLIAGVSEYPSAKTTETV